MQVTANINYDLTPYLIIFAVIVIACVWLMRPRKGNKGLDD
jgi:hypothetical protein